MRFINVTKSYTVSDLSMVLNISIQATWKKVKRIGLQTTKELINNRLTTMIILDDAQLNDLILSTKNNMQVEQQNKPVYQPNHSLDEQPNKKVYQPEYEEISTIDSSKTWQDVISDMSIKMVELAKQAGKTELLTDTLMTSNQDIKYYQDEYFKLKFQVDGLTRVNQQLSEQVEQLRKQIGLQKSFFGLKFGK